MDANSFTVQYLKDNFNSFSYEQKIQVKSVGRPKPELNLSQTTKGKFRDFTRKFKKDMYEKNDWILVKNLHVLDFVNTLRFRPRAATGLKPKTNHHASVFFNQVPGHQAIGVKTEGRIVGGKDANEGQFPYAASVQINGKHCCGGSIIDPRWILTAAHCVVSSPGSVEKPTALRVMVGSVLLSKATTYYNVSKVVPHSKFIFNLLKADIALLQLEEEILFSRNVQKIELELDGVIKETPIVCGWGILDRKGTLPDRLQFLQTEIIPHSRCNRLLEEEDIMRADSSQICDLSSEYGQTSKGDSGGPLVVDDKQIGLVSYGEYGRDIPAVNTNVSYFYDWIQEHISGNSYKFKLDERYYFS